jgi:hypothetical protein
MNVIFLLKVDNMRKKMLLMTKLLASNQQIKVTQHDGTDVFFEKESNLLNSYDSNNGETNSIWQAKYEDLKRRYDSDFDAKLIVIKQLEIELREKSQKIEELNENENNNVFSNGEIIKNHNKLYESVINVNKRLETELIKLRAENAALNVKLNKRHLALAQ